MYFTYFSPDDMIQGGANEAGLFFDFNAIPETEYKDYEKKKDYPGGHDALMRYFLKNCETVEEVFAMYKKYRNPCPNCRNIYLLYFLSSGIQLC